MAANEEAAAFTLFQQAWEKLLQQGILQLDTDMQMERLSNSIQKIIDAKAMQRKSNKRTWLCQLKNVASDIDDIFYLFSAKNGNHKIPASLSKMGNVCSQRVNRKISLQEMKVIRMRLDKISRELHFLSVQSNTEHEIAKMSIIHSPVETLTLSSKNEDQEKIIDLLLSVKHKDQVGPCIVPIIRKGGVATTELAQAIFNDKRIANHFGRRIWVNASEGIDVGKLSKLIRKPASTLFWVHKTLDKNLEEEQILIILDDIRNECVDHELRWLELERTGTRRKVVVHTPVIETRYLPCWNMIKDTPHSVERLSAHDSWKMFKEHVFLCACGFKNKWPVCKDNYLNLQLEAIGRGICKNLGGSPSMIRAMGYILSSTLESTYWKLISESEVWKLPVQEERVLPTLVELCYGWRRPVQHLVVRWWPEERQHENNSRKLMKNKLPSCHKAYSLIGGSQSRCFQVNKLSKPEVADVLPQLCISICDSFITKTL